MNYSKIYDDLIRRAKSRKPSSRSYYEKHHIIPRCLGGSNEKDNLVKLTPEEHFVAHLLLTKMFPASSKLVFAANMMGNRTNKNYGWLRRKHAAAMKGRSHSEASKQKMSVARKGVAKSEEWKHSLSESKKLRLEYKGEMYSGYAELQEKTGVSRHLYLKFYVNGIDPKPYIGNNTYNFIGSRWKNRGS